MVFNPPRNSSHQDNTFSCIQCTPLPQHSLLSGHANLVHGARTHGETPLAMPLMIFMTPWAQQSEVKGGCQPDFRPAFPKRGPDLTDGTPYTTNLHVFLRPLVGSLKSKILGSTNLIKIKNRPRHAKGPGAAAPFRYPPPPPPPHTHTLLRLVGLGCVLKSDPIFRVRPSKSSLGPLKPFWPLFGLTRSPTSA